MRIIVGCIVLMGCARVDEPAEESDAAPPVVETAGDSAIAETTSLVASSGTERVEPFAPSAATVRFRMDDARILAADRDATGALYFSGVLHDPKARAAVWKVDATGALLWATSVPGFTSASIAATEDGGVLAAGCHEPNEIDFLAYCKGIEVTRFGVDGAVLWDRVYLVGGALTSIALSHDAVYVGGEKQGSVTIGSLPPTASDSALLLAAFSLDGTPKWARGFPAPTPTGAAPGSAVARAIVYDQTRARLVVAGDSFGTIDLGDHADVVPAKDEGKLHGRGFVAGFDLDGVVQWSKYFPTDWQLGVKSVDVATDGSVAIGGFYTASITLDGHRFTAPFTPSGGGPQPYAFVARLDAAHEFQWLSTWGIPDGSLASQVRFDDDDVVAFGARVAWSNLREWHSHVGRYAGKDGALLGELGLQEVGSDGRTTGFVDAGHSALVVSSCDASTKQVNKSCLSKTIVIDAHL